jgi:hypothetical protein
MRNGLYALVVAIVVFIVVWYCEFVFFSTPILSDLLPFPTTLSLTAFLLTYRFVVACQRQQRPSWRFYVLYAIGSIVLMALVWWITLFVVLWIGLPKIS